MWKFEELDKKIGRQNLLILFNRTCLKEFLPAK